MDVVTLGMAKSEDAKVRNLATKGNGTIWGLGDSITNNGRTVTANGTVYDARSHLMTAVLLSGGRLRFGGIAATGGYTSQQIIDTHLPTVLAARPQFCVVHAMTNDLGTLTEAQSMANLTTIVDSLTRNGTTAILTTMLPKHTEISSSAARLQRLSLFVKRLARDRGLPCVDWRDLFAAPSNDDWTGYSGGTGPYNMDDTHPNEAGAAAMAQAVVDAINPLLPALRPWLPTANINSGNLSPSDSNALMLTDSNADGIPEQWSVAGTNPAGSTFALSALSEGRGNWFTITRPAGATDLNVQTNPVTLVPGNRVAVAMRLKTANMQANGASFDVRLLTSDTTTDLWGLKVWKRDIASTILSGEFTVPAGITAGKFYVTLRTAACSVSIGQILLIDLTAKGLA